MLGYFFSQAESYRLKLKGAGLSSALPVQVQEVYTGGLPNG